MLKKLSVLFVLIALSACGPTAEVVVEDPVVVPDPVPVVEEVVSTGDSLESADDEWNLYTNFDEGYSLKVPKNSLYSNCEQEMETVEVTVLREDNISWVTPVSRFDFSAECVSNAVDSITEERGTPWKIVSADVSNDAELEAFVKEMYGDGCTVAGIKVTGDVEINTSGPDGGCFINYITSIKYNEVGGKAFSFDIGQDTNFFLEDVQYDTDMLNSFEFLK